MGFPSHQLVYQRYREEAPLQASDYHSLELQKSLAISLLRGNLLGLMKSQSAYFSLVSS